MLQIELDWQVSFSLLAENRAETKEQSPLSSALSSASCRRSVSLSSVAPILRTSVKSLSCLFIYPSQWGHLYFAE